MRLFRTPSSILVVGPSGSGKTVFVSRLLRDPARYFRPWIPNIHYCYGAWQDGFEGMKRQTSPRIHFHEGLPAPEDLTRWFSTTKGGLLVLDDLMNEGSSDQRVLDLFTKHSHHRNITVLYLCQDMFPVGKYAKTISRNAHYIVAFKNPRDQLGFKNLIRQAFDHWRDVLDVYKRVTDRPYGYVILDLHPNSSA